jgi:hypothetical protein
MYKAEIISNQSIQDNIIELLNERIKDFQYTIIPEVYGSGINTKKFGDTVWPEMNFVMFAYVEKEEAKLIKKTIDELKKRFPREGISVFFTKSEEL